LQHTADDVRVVVRVGRPDAAVPPQPPTTVVGAPLPSDQPVAAIEVCDAGAGMAEDVAARVFERLYRADSSRSRKSAQRSGADGQAVPAGNWHGRQGGAGLGLAIVAAMVQAHGGRIELWTAPGRGARFRVLLPAEPVTTDE
jgi:two-component system OmpR family sensor kinase